MAPLIRVADIFAGESDAFVNVRFTLSAASTQTITVNYATGYSTADSNVDFDNSSGTIAFAAGETTKTVRVPLIADTTVEPSEVFLFNLSSPSNAQLERTSSTITIVDNDGATNILSGGISDDTYTVDSPNDVVIESSIGGKDTVLASISYTLPSHVENLTLTGKRGIRATGNALDNQISGNSGNNLLKGFKGKDSLDGGLGEDTLTGGLGNDTLTGSAGADVFRFDAALNDAKNRDSLTDFNPAEGDGIQLENSIFSALGIPGSLPSEAFAFGARARDFSQHILYNATTGALAYDQDGDGPIAAIRFAVLSPDLALTSSAFTVT
jgi:Ca2+-binding RTX toxin-like protein